MQATPGVHHRMLGQAQVGRSWCYRKTSGSAKPSSGSCWFCFNISSSLLQVLRIFWTLLFNLMPSLALKSLGNSDWWLSSTFIWVVLDKCAHSLSVKPSHTPHLGCCSYLGRWCYPGCLPWGGWASTLRSSNACGYRHLQTSLDELRWFILQARIGETVIA